VYLVRGGKAVRTRVRRGATYQGRIEIVDGLAPGDSVIVAGNNMVRDGGAIRLATSPTLDSSATDTLTRPQATANRPGGTPR
jgi:hypothetical protein